MNYIRKLQTTNLARKSRYFIFGSMTSNLCNMKTITENELKELYIKNFKANDYHWLQNADILDDADNFILTGLSKIFAKPEIKGSSLLEIGTGPVISNIACACKKFSHIVLSDFLQDNRDALKKWLSNDKKALDWTRHLIHCAKLQGYKDENAGRMELESIIRANVKAVTECDLLKDPIVLDPYNVTYDAVLTSLTLASVCTSFSTYKNSLKKIGSLIKDNGHLIICGFTKSTFYTINNHKFPVLSLSHEEIQEALEEAGFNNVEWRLLFNNKKESSHDWYNYESTFCLNCTKDTRKK